MSERLSYRGGVLQEDNPELKEAARKKAERKLGAKILSGVGFQDRQREVVDASLAKERARGEKFEGKNQARRNEAYLERLDRIIEKDGTALEEKLWEKSVDNLIIEPENIEENYWRTQEQVLRDNGQGRELGDYEKQILTEDIQKRQRESLRSWANYLGNEDAPYPMWFKVYAWDGVSKMGVFDKEKGEFKVRNKHTVAPYPKLNPAVLAKVHGAISDFYGHKDEERYREGEERDEELEVLVRSGNFNRLYSKFLLEQKSIPPTPERTEDVHGSWIEYLPGQEEALANAAEGTPWCIADPGTAKSYLERGVYGQADDEDWEDWDDEEGAESKAKFILFHFEDPETGNLAENACASIRLGTDGQVAEISGLNEGQALEDALVPIVEEKVKTLPGGERFLEAFADKQELIKLDRKMQIEEKLTEGELRFVFESDRKIKTLDTYNRRDPRVKELKGYFWEHLGEYTADDVSGAIHGMRAKQIDTHFEQLAKIGVEPDVLAEKMKGYDVYTHFDRLIELGADPKVVACNISFDRVSDPHVQRLLELGVGIDELLENKSTGVVGDDFDLLIDLGADMNKLLWHFASDDVEVRFDQLVDLGVSPDRIVENVSAKFVEEHFDRLLELGANLDLVVENMSYDSVGKDFDKLLGLGADPNVLAHGMRMDDIWKHFEQLCNAGVGLNKLIEDMDAFYVAGHFEQLLSIGADLNVLVQNMAGEGVTEHFDRMIELGADINKVVKRMDWDGVDERLKQIIDLGVDLDVLVEAMLFRVDDDEIELYRKKMIEAGVDAGDLDKVIENYMKEYEHEYDDDDEDEDEDEDDDW